MAGLSQLLFSFIVHNLFFAGVLRFIWGIFIAAILPLLFMQLRQLAKKDAIGKNIGMGHSASKLGALIGISVGALSISVFAINQGFLIITLIYSIMFIIILFFAKK